jgi:hypothetical protein
MLVDVNLLYQALVIIIAALIALAGHKWKCTEYAWWMSGIVAAIGGGWACLGYAQSCNQWFIDMNQGWVYWLGLVWAISVICGAAIGFAAAWYFGQSPYLGEAMLARTGTAQPPPPDRPEAPTPAHPGPPSSGPGRESTDT